MRTGLVIVVLILSGCAGPPPAGELVCVNTLGVDSRTTCNALCASMGSSCIPNPPDDHACGTDPRFNNPSGTVLLSTEDCARGAGSRAQYEDGCDVPIAGPADIDFAPMSVACCCAL